MPNIQDVAKRANVSVTTVSRVLNNRGYISQQTREKVYKAMKELDYHPNELARSFYRKRTNTIGLIIPDVSNPFFAEMTKNLEIRFYAQGYKIMLCNAIEKSNRERDYIDMLRRHKVDGIVIGSHTLEIDEYLKIGLFIVALDRFLGDTIPTVSADHRKGGYLAARELINNGCKHVAQFMGEPRVSTPANERYYAFEEEMKKNNIACETINVGWNVFNIEDVINPVKEVLDKYDDIDGIFGSDMVAASALKEAERRGIDVPSHLKIVGYDGIFVTKITSPEITTIKQPMPEIADSIVKLMIDQINGKRCEPKLHIKLDVALIKGGTTI